MRNQTCPCQTWSISGPDTEERFYHQEALWNGEVHHPKCPTALKGHEVIEAVRYHLGSGARGRALFLAEMSGESAALDYANGHAGKLGYVVRLVALVRGAVAELLEHTGLDLTVDVADYLGENGESWLVFSASNGESIEAEVVEGLTAADVFKLMNDTLSDLLGVFEPEEPNCYVPGRGWTVV